MKKDSKKIIHYCWFGNKKMSKLAIRCLKSWEKFFPDYEIMQWNETNIDINECNFIHEAYDQKKWAFVADYARTKALKEYGGLYFDTDMEVLKRDNSLFENDTFLGVEDTGYIAVGVWYEKNKNAFLPSELIKIYQGIEKIDFSNLSEISIPKLISKILNTDEFEFGINKIQKTKNGIVIYPREYFYPHSYDYQNNKFTNNTSMIHYYDASWLPIRDRIEIKLIRKFGRKFVVKTIYIVNTIRYALIKLIKFILHPLLIYRNNSRKITIDYCSRINNTIKAIDDNKNKDYIVLHNGNWLGVTSATKELFNNTVDCGEIYRKKESKMIGNAILENNINQVIFSSFSEGDPLLVKYLKKKNPNIKIKSYWHGNHSQVLDEYGWKRNVEIIKLYRKGLINVMGSCKKSLINFYRKENLNGFFITNKVITDIKPTKSKSNEIRIGIYAAKCDDWRKNMYSQIAAVSLIENAVIDMVPLNDSAKKIAKIFGVKLDGSEKSMPRNDLIERMSKNTINLYVTFSECAPMLPLESMEMNVPCITGNNHHYFQNSELGKYLVIKNEENPIEIKNAILKCIDNNDKIIKLYKKFRKENLDESSKEIKEFLEK